MAEQQRDDDLLDVEPFDMAGTRPAMLLGLPHSLACSIMAVGILFVMLYNTGQWVQDLIADFIAIGALGMLWTTAKVLLRSDYHGWDNFLAYLRLDFRCLDTREWGGARLATLPLRSNFRCGAGDV